MVYVVKHFPAEVVRAGGIWSETIVKRLAMARGAYVWSLALNGTR